MLGGAGGGGCSRLDVVVVFSLGHHGERVVEVGLAGLSLLPPHLVETLTADTARKVGMELLFQ